MASLRSTLGVLLSAILVSVLLVACGGGGGGGGGGDTVAPLLQSTSPANNATGVSPDSAINITFNEALDCATATTANINISPASGLTRTSCAGNSVAFSTSGQAFQTQYTVTIDNGVADLAGNNYAGSTFRYTTGAESDTSAPLLQSLTPANNATGITPDSAVNITFNEAIDCATAATAINISPGAMAAPTCPGNSVVFNTSGQTFETQYTVTIGTELTDLAGNNYAGLTFGYTTGAEPDTTPPLLQSTSPTNNATGVSLNSAVNITFNEAIDCATAATAINISPGAMSAPTCPGNSVAFNTSGQAFSTQYTVTIGTGLADLAGNNYAGSNFSYTTSPNPDTNGPVVVSIAPTGGLTNVEPDASVTITWNEAVADSTVNSTNITIAPSDAPWTRTGFTGTTATFTPAGQIYATDYTVSVSTSVTDTAGNAGTATSETYSTRKAAYPTAADAFEPDDSLANASTFIIGSQPQARTIFGPTDEDWIAVDLTADNEYEFSVNHLNAVGDSFLEMYVDELGTPVLQDEGTSYGTLVLTNPSPPPIIDFNDDYTPEGNLLVRHSRILFNPDITQTYYFRVRTRDQGLSDSSGQMTYVFSAHPYVNNDNDSFSAYYDCNDSNETIHPEGFDVPDDGIDQNCSGDDEYGDTTPDANEPDTFSTASVMVPRTNGAQNNYLHEVYAGNARTIHADTDSDYFTVTVPPNGGVLLDFLFDTLGGDLLGDIYSSGQVEGIDIPDTPVVLQGHLLGNTTGSPEVYTIRFHRTPGSSFGGYYVPTYIDIGVDMDSDGFYTQDIDDLRDCNDALPGINPGAADNTLNGIDENCDGTDGV